MPTLSRDASVVRTVRATVTGLDALTLGLKDADFVSAALSVEALSDAIDEQADVLDSRAGEVSADSMIETLDYQVKALKNVTRELHLALSELGRC